MLTRSRDWPADAVFADLFPQLEPQSLLRAVKAAQGPAADGFSTCRIIEALYDPGQHIRVACCCGPEAVSEERAWPDSEVFYVRYPVRTPMSRRGTVIQLNGHPCELYRFPNDRRLRGLRKFSKRPNAAAVWQEWLDAEGEGVRLDPDSLRRGLLRYVPEQKWIVRLLGRSVDDDKMGVAVRSAGARECSVLHARLLAARVAGRHQEGAFRLLEPIALDARLGLLATRWVWGDEFLEMLPGSDMTLMNHVARGLQALHLTDLPDLPVVDTDAHLQHAASAVADIAASRPQLAADLEKILEDLRRTAPPVPAATVTVHNDFHWKQLRGRPHRLTMLDLERCSRGDGLVDVAQFAVQLGLLGHRPALGVSTTDAREAQRRFLEAWETTTGQAIDPRRLAWYGTCALLTLGRGQLRHLRQGWTELVDTCVAQAEGCSTRDLTEVCI